MVLNPGSLDVIVASNLHGDILSDLAAALAGSLGIAASGNLDPSGNNPSMFEPVHGSAPDIIGNGIANPIAAIWSGAMMCEHLGEAAGSSRLMAAIAKVAKENKVMTRDLGGDASTENVTDAIIAAVRGDDLDLEIFNQLGT
jgi:tartrate dehydrogenase/decarboxylase/D-malate dehydrogenase